MARLLILFMIIPALAACTETGTYPVSGEECAEGDPVQDISTAECTALPGGTGTF